MLERTGQRLAMSTTAATALANGMTLERLTHPDAPPDELFANVARLIMARAGGRPGCCRASRAAPTTS